MKRITALKIKQRQNLNLLNFIKDTNLKFKFLDSSDKLPVDESIDFYNEILSLKKSNQMLIEATETQDKVLISKKIINFIKNISDEDLLFNVSFSQYKTFLDDGEYYNISPLPVFKLNKDQISFLFDCYIYNNLYFLVIISDNFKLVLDSYAGNTNSSEPDLPTYEYFEEIK
ncbi:hypothetical protein ACT4YX_12275 [Acinetobacter baumannii]|uniref:hypothetical protein n=1 Tax=Acinetobacter baumannii TaxID=470 RepID=UPI0029405514|nr:hypothetical protein [Acinetobacter baumannii]EKU0940635.1 hypothetical protein [Acinetobacter baumannii]EKX7142486.1 hypothetical protein [Acinetobacter baumannii]MCZ2946900.1 hypothetical protein [Acinetobacter baumannii]MCZ3332323.1 hypothetical protein [Acinetobacter baumannii]MDV4301922.1 hypothetical protein [Acinetobacter baumannii]